MTAAVLIVGASLIVVGEIIGLVNNQRADTITGWTERHVVSFVAMLGLIGWAAAHFVFASTVAEAVGLAAGVGVGMYRWQTARERNRR